MLGGGAWGWILAPPCINALVEGGAGTGAWEWCQEVEGMSSPSVDGGYHRGQVALEGCRLHQISCLGEKEPSALLLWGERGVRKVMLPFPGWHSWALPCLRSFPVVLSSALIGFGSLATFVQ